jgi:hypothetical protein
MIKLIKTMIKVLSNHNNFERLESMISYKMKSIIIRNIISNKNNNKHKKIKLIRHLQKPNKRVSKINKSNKKKIKEITNNRKGKRYLRLGKIFNIIKKIIKTFNSLISKNINIPLIKYNLQLNKQGL